MGGFNNIPDVVKNLLIINLLVFLAGIAIENVELLLALRHPKSPDFEPYQLVSHFFTHFGFWHILMNMFALVVFGSTLERRWGPKRFLLFYFACAMGASGLHLGYISYETAGVDKAITEFENEPTAENYSAFFQEYATLKNYKVSYQSDVNTIRKGLKNTGENSPWVEPALVTMKQFLNSKLSTPMAGASGAIFGLLMAFFLLFPNTELMLLFIPFPIKAKYLIGAYLVYNLYSAFTGAEDGVAYFAHLGGALIGFIIVKLWQRDRNSFY
jgi:membrane associated rhomboid family serine protease